VTTAHLIATVVLSLAAFLTAAKAHGREVRLEREAKGHHEVVFGGTNHPDVEAIWQRDRWVYWPSAALGLVLGVASFTLRGPGVFVAAGWLDVALESVFRLVVFPMTFAFFTAGAASILRKLRAEVRPVPAATYGWWTLATVLVGSVVVVRHLQL
jgi:hypothetical protein